jgi:replicative DNA helicase
MLDLEREVVGRFILKEDVRPFIAQRLKPEHFLDPVLKKLIADGMKQFSDSGTINPTALGRAIGGDGYLSELINSVNFLGEIGVLVEELLEDNRRRALGGLGGKISGWLECGEASEVIMGRVEEDLGKLTHGGNTEQTMSDVARKILEDAVAVREGKQELGISTPWEGLNKITRGLRPGTMVVVSGCTSVGKSQFLLELAYHASLLEKRVLFYSLEMTAGQIFARLAARHTGINTLDIEVGKFGEKDGKKIEELGGLCDEAGFKVIDNLRSAEKIRWRTRAEDAREKIGLVIVDYIQQVSGPGSLYERVSEACRIFFDLSREVSAPVIVASQISQEAAKAERKGEALGAFGAKGAGELVEKPDVCIHLKRDKDQLNVVVTKNRFGWPGEFIIGFSKSWTKLAEMRGGK